MIRTGCKQIRITSITVTGILNSVRQNVVLDNRLVEVAPNTGDVILPWGLVTGNDHKKFWYQKVDEPYAVNPYVHLSGYR